MNSVTLLLGVHLISIALSISLFVLRYGWRECHSARAHARWTRVVPPVVDTFLLLSGVGLIAKTHILPFTEQGTWLTEKLFGVIIYIALGFIALGRRRPRSQQSRFIAFLLALVVLFIIIQLAITRIPILG